MEPDQQLLEFPCIFPIKAFGKSGPEFEAAVMEIMRAHVPDLAEGAVRSQESKGGKYTSMTVTINAVSQRQLDDIYRALTSHELVTMAL